MFMTEILQRKLLVRNLMHRRARVRNRTNLISIKLLPPVQRSSDVEIDGNHPHELTMIGTGISQSVHQICIIRTNPKFTIIRVRSQNMILPLSWSDISPIRITLLPRVLRVSHTTNGVLPAYNLGVFSFQHFLPPQASSESFPEFLLQSNECYCVT